MTIDEATTFLNEAQRHVVAGDYMRAEKLARSILQETFSSGANGSTAAFGSAQSDDSRKDYLTLHGRVLHLIGVCCRYDLRPEEAINVLTQAISIALRSESLNLQSQVLNELAQVQIFCNEYQRAQENATSALEKAERVGDLITQLTSLHTLGDAAWNLSDFNHALELTQKSLVISELLNSQSSLAQSYGNLGLIYMELSDNAHAFEYYQKSKSTYEDLGDLSGISRQNCNIGCAYRSLSDYPQALTYFREALAMSEELVDRSGVARNLANIALVHHDLGDYATAMTFYHQALVINSDDGDKRGEATNTGNLGRVYLALADGERALEYFTKALAMHEEAGSKSGMAIWLGNIGTVYGNLSESTLALTYFKKALSMSEDIGDKEGVANNLGNLGDVLVGLKDFDRALEFFRRSHNMYEMIGQKNGLARMKSTIGAVYSSHEFEGYDADMAQEYLSQAITSSEDLGTKDYESHKTLSTLYERQGRTAEALHHFKRYHDLEKEVQSEEAKKKAIQIEQLRQIAEREKEIAIAKAAANAELKATTSLLHKVLPESIARRMIDGEEEIADYFPNVSILFADIAGFTPLSADMPAFIVVRFLNFVFREFDRIVKKHGCEKIKTIGDGYMAVAGAPVECTDHAERIASAALEMMQTISLPDDIREYLPEGTQFGVRIGIHTGSVVAGVIGEERFVYDVYSDAVNTAARMESHGEPNRIHVSSEFVRHLQSRYAMAKNTGHRMLFEKRGEMEIKGKGMMKTYFLEQTQ